MNFLCRTNDLWLFSRFADIKNAERKTLHILTPSDLHIYQSFQNLKRRKEWLSVRFALSEIAGKEVYIKYEKSGKPLRSDGKALSVSHSGELIALATGDAASYGADVEIIGEKIKQIAHKFIPESKLVSIKDKLPAIYLQWSGKEALYKMSDLSGLDFKKNLRIEIPNKIQESGLVSGELRHPKSNFKCKLNYRFIDYKKEKYLLVFGKIN